jgi:hypothetical protein
VREQQLQLAASASQSTSADGATSWHDGVSTGGGGTGLLGRSRGTSANGGVYFNAFIDGQQLSPSLPPLQLTPPLPLSRQPQLPGLAASDDAVGPTAASGRAARSSGGQPHTPAASGQPQQSQGSDRLGRAPSQQQYFDATQQRSNFGDDATPSVQLQPAPQGSGSSEAQSRGAAQPGPFGAQDSVGGLAQQRLHTSAVEPTLGGRPDSASVSTAAAAAHQQAEAPGQQSAQGAGMSVPPATVPSSSTAPNRRLSFGRATGLNSAASSRLQAAEHSSGARQEPDQLAAQPSLQHQHPAAGAVHISARSYASAQFSSVPLPGRSRPSMQPPSQGPDSQRQHHQQRFAAGGQHHTAYLQTANNDLRQRHSTGAAAAGQLPHSLGRQQERGASGDQSSHGAGVVVAATDVLSLQDAISIGETRCGVPKATQLCCVELELTPLRLIPALGRRLASPHTGRQKAHQGAHSRRCCIRVRRLRRLQAALEEAGPAAGTPDKAARTAASLAHLRAQAPVLRASLHTSTVRAAAHSTDTGPACALGRLGCCVQPLSTAWWPQHRWNGRQDTRWVLPPLLQDASGVVHDVAAAAQHWQARLERASERVASLQRKAAARSPSTASLRAGS